MDIADQIAENFEIDPKKPTFDMVFTWIGLGFDMEEVKKVKIVKWQPDELVDKWRGFEFKLVDAAVNGGSGFDIAKTLPPVPFQSIRQMLYKHGLSLTSDSLLARIEIVILKDKLSLVVYDNLKYAAAKTMFWEEYGKAFDEKHALREDFARYTKANMKAIAKTKENPPRHAGKWWYQGVKPVEFKAHEIQRVWENEEPAVILAAWQKQNEKNGQNV